MKQTDNRAYCVFEVKAVHEDDGIIEGIASTPGTDRVGDIVDPKGAVFKLPIPLLWQHDAHQPVGHVFEARAASDGIRVKAKVFKGLLPRITEAWAMVKAGLVRGLSIGFKGLESEQIIGTTGMRFRRWEWLELSLVTIPANAEASIHTIKSLDAPHLQAALGNVPVRGGVVSLSDAPGVSGLSTSTLKGTDMKTIQEQIAAFEQRRQASAARMADIMAKAAEDASTLDEVQQEEYDTLEGEIEALDAHIGRLKKHEAIMAKTATPVTRATVEDLSGEPGVAVRKGAAITVQSNLPKATAFTRYAIALARSKGNLVQALEISKQWHDSTPEVETVLKAAVAAGDTTSANWATELADYSYMASEFVEMLRPATIVGRISGLRRVPFMIRMPKAASGVSAGWVGQGAPKPVSKMDFDTVTLAQHKLATIVVLTEELVRFSNPSAEAVVRQDMIDAISQYMDGQFTDPTVAASGAVSPASITNGVTGVPSTGATVAAIMTDIQSLFQRLIAGNVTPKAGVWIMHPRTALYLSMLRTAQDVYAFPGITMTGGTFYGMPVVTSSSVPIDTGNDTYIILMDAAEVYLADDGGVTLDVSREASLQMDSAPQAGAQSLVSLWQNNLVGLRAERFVTWKRRRDEAVAVLEDVTY